jgi:LPS O-antigen subunit length determinant protein (WzzB/FepE family)
MKTVAYYCPGCRKKIARQVPKAFQRYESFCATAGRPILMRKLKHQKAALDTISANRY